MFALALLLTLTPLVKSQCTLSASGGDDGPNFLKAVNSPSCSMVTIPSGNTLNIGTRMNMTGLTNKHINLQGTIKLSANIPYWTGNAFPIAFQASSAAWLLGGKNILLDGAGTIDGSGQAWYDAFASNSSLLRPIVLTVSNGNGVTVQNIKMINSPSWMNFVTDSKNVTFSGITINSASTSSHDAKNTDGWDTYRSSNVIIRDSVINNGDDCVSFKPNSTDILVSNLNCTGSHGISVGSLGQYSGIYDIVQNVLATNVHMTNAENGARIKAFAGPGVGSGLVKNITFTGFVVSKVDSPIVIDQCYETSSSACVSNPSNVLIQDVWFENVSGKASSSTVASLACSPDSRCSDINVDNFSVQPGSGKAKYTCQNVDLDGNSASLFGTCKTTS